mmetsp:Transcript_25153/g.54689  ORF Transcript_25153/g.54689 Transcript_25153/m.54689 type:complete len:188 (+) Transcript_25153:155-718(+)
MGKMDPSAQDKWWRSRIEKEEATYVNKSKQKATTETKLILNTIGAPQQVPAPAAETHLVGAGALVRQAKAVGLDALSDAPAKNEAGGSKAASIANSKVSKVKADLEARSVASGGRSHISYPRTPQFSQAGSAVDTEIMSRLARLEKDLVAEKVRREAAEKEMKELLNKGATPPPEMVAQLQSMGSGK